MPRQRAANEVAQAAARAFALFWAAECRKIEEHIPDPAARWAIMVEALAKIARQD
jgi:hypothetical protein